MNHTILCLTPAEAMARSEALIDLLVDSVEGGASVNFIWPMTRAKAEKWWSGALDGHGRGDRLIFTAENDGRVDGTVQLVFAPQENQAFRGDIAKMLVHSRARRQGLGAALLHAAEQAAVERGLKLLTLDTVSDSAGDRLYRRAQWVPFGIVPGFATKADGLSREAATFFYNAV